MPIETFTNKDIDCISDFQIAHHREGEGYTDNWFDMEDDQNYQAWMSNGATDETVSTYKVTIPENDGDVYFTVESYYR